jgi:hypothetical protein
VADWSTALLVDDEKGDFVVISHDLSMIFWVLNIKHLGQLTNNGWLMMMMMMIIGDSTSQYIGEFLVFF